MRIDLSIANRNVDLVGEGYDLAIRHGALRDSALIGRQLEEASLHLVAAPGYVARAGQPDSLAALAGHACLPFVMPGSGRVGPWLFRDEGRDVEWQPTGQVMVSDDVLGTIALAESGLGICQVYDFIAQEKIAQGRLVEVLARYRGRSRPFSVIYPPHRQLSPAARALIDWLVANTAKAPPSA